jgi:hypothetical protein
VREGSHLIGCVFASSQAISARIEVERLVAFMKAMDLLHRAMRRV